MIRYYKCIKKQEQGQGIKGRQLPHCETNKGFNQNTVAKLIIKQGLGDKKGDNVPKQ